MNRIVATTAVAMTLVLGLGVAGAQRRKASSDTEKPPSKKELQRLVSAAKTAEEHHKIASYYLQSAERLEQEAADHEALAKEYRTQPPRLLKRDAADRTLTVAHCNNFAAFARKAAAEERALASVHERATTEAAARP